MPHRPPVTQLQPWFVVAPLPAAKEPPTTAAALLKATKSNGQLYGNLSCCGRGYINMQMEWWAQKEQELDFHAIVILLFAFFLSRTTQRWLLPLWLYPWDLFSFRIPAIPNQLECIVVQLPFTTTLPDDSIMFSQWHNNGYGMRKDSGNSFHWTTTGWRAVPRWNCRQYGEKQDKKSRSTTKPQAGSRSAGGSL